MSRYEPFIDEHAAPLIAKLVQYDPYIDTTQVSALAIVLCRRKSVTNRVGRALWRREVVLCIAF